jgi:hypothetical protein
MNFYLKLVIIKVAFFGLLIALFSLPAKAEIDLTKQDVAKLVALEVGYLVGAFSGQVKYYNSLPPGTVVSSSRLAKATASAFKGAVVGVAIAYVVFEGVVYAVDNNGHVIESAEKDLKKLKKQAEEQYEVIKKKI